MSRPETQFRDEEFEIAIRETLKQSPVITSRQISDIVGCSRELARQYLVSKYEQGTLERTKVGGGAKIYYPDYESFVPTQNQEGEEDIVPTQTEDNISTADKEERILFFPSRREIAVDDPQDETKSILSKTSHLVDSTEDGYLYKVSKEDIWNTPYESFDDLSDDLKKAIGTDKWDGGFENRIKEDWKQANKFTLRTEVKDDKKYTVLESDTQQDFEDVAKRKLEFHDHYTEFVSDTEMRIKDGAEAEVKEILYEAGYPVIDNRILESGASLDIELEDEFELRDYQQDWIDHFLGRKSGVFVGPSGSGKTIAAIGAMSEIQGETLIIVPNREIAQQWQDELLEKTNLWRAGKTNPQIGQYHGGEKTIAPITIATYDTAAMSRHRKLFNERQWGLVIADECHHAVADTWKRFRDVQSKARLGLSATPIRESGDAKEIYTLIGPPVGTDWGDLFADEWVAKPNVEMIMVPWESDKHRKMYREAKGSRKLIEAAKNPKKLDVIRNLTEKYGRQKKLIFVDWVDQGKEFSEELGIPLIYGQTSHDRREELYEQLREGERNALMVSRVGDEGIDLPDVEVAILASTRGSSRSQTGQRAGRTMRPFGDSKVFMLLTKGSGEQDWGRESTQYLAEKGIDVSRREWNP